MKNTTYNTEFAEHAETEQLGAKTLTHADLIAASGCRAKVCYRDAQGLWTANEIRISCRNVVPNEVPSSATPER